LGGIPDFESEVDGGVLVDGKGDGRADRFLKAGEFGGNAIFAREEARSRVIAGAIGPGGELKLCLEVDELDGRVGECTAGAIGDNTGNCRRGLLRGGCG
jgi:hypothetical protein